MTISNVIATTGKEAQNIVVTLRLVKDIFSDCRTGFYMAVGFIFRMYRHDALTHISLCHENCGMIFYDVEKTMVGRTHSSVYRSVSDQLPVHHSCVVTT